MSKTKTLTIRLDLKDKDKAKWLWDSASENKEINGVKVRALSWGDMFERCDLLEELVKLYQKHIGIYEQARIEDQVAELEEKINKTWG